MKTKKRAFYSKVCSAKRMLVKYESGNENQNVIGLKNIIIEANWKIDAKFQHTPNATFMILLALIFPLKGKHGKIDALLLPKSLTTLVMLPGTVTYLLYFALGSSSCINLNPTHNTFPCTHGPFVLCCFFYLPKT